MLENYELNTVTDNNLKELAKRHDRISKQRVCEIHELAFGFAEIFSEMRSEDYGIYEILSFISEELSRYELTKEDKISFSSELLEILRKNEINLSEADFLQSEHKTERIALLKNTLSNEAYDVFSQDLKSPRLTYTDTLSSAVMAVAREEAEYCILPFEEKGGIRVSAVRELLFKYDLKINKVTPVFGPLGTADMRYALVSKSFTVPKPQRDDDRYLEIRLRADLSFSLSELISTAESYGASVYRINSVRFAEEDGACEYYELVFSMLGGDFVLLLNYLTLFSRAYTAVGIYKNLE